MIRCPPADRRGFSIVEGVLSTLLVSIVLAVGLRAAAYSSVTQYKTAQRATALQLGQSLLADITALPYEDPNVAPLFGREAGESSSSKVNYDDIDDFNGWVESPPQERDGSAMTGLPGWQRSVVVHRVNPSNLNTVVVAESGAKRVTVSVSHNGVVVLTRAAHRTKAP
jgi:hypothetical protein